MDILDKIGQIINEASTLSKIGVTPAQIKSIYRRSDYGRMVPDADAEWQKVNGKKAATDLVRAGDSYRVAVAGLDRDGNLFLITSRASEFVITKYFPDGQVDTFWYEKSPRKAMSYMTGVRDYYIARQAGSIASKGKRELDAGEEFDNSALASRLVKVIGKEGEKLFQEYKAKAAAKISEKLNSGDFTGAHKLLMNWVETGNFSRDTRDSTMRDMLTGRGWNSRDFHDWLGEIVNGGAPGSFGYSPAIDKILKSASDAELRKGGAELLKEIRTKLEDAIKE